MLVEAMCRINVAKRKGKEKKRGKSSCNLDVSAMFEVFITYGCLGCCGSLPLINVKTFSFQIDSSSEELLFYQNNVSFFFGSTDKLKKCDKNTLIR